MSMNVCPMYYIEFSALTIVLINVVIEVILNFLVHIISIKEVFYLKVQTTITTPIFVLLFFLFFLAVVIPYYLIYIDYFFK